MFLRRKLTVMATVALLSTSLLAGCSSSGRTQMEEVMVEELQLQQKYLPIKCKSGYIYDNR